MVDLYLVAEADGTRFAIPAGDVENVVRKMEIVPVPLAEPYVAGIAALRSRVVAVVDLMAAITGERAGDTLDKPVVVVRLGRHYYGLAVDEVRDIVEASTAPEPVTGSRADGWRRTAAGFVETEFGAVIVIEPDRLFAPPAKAA